MEKASADGLWDATYGAELGATHTLASQLGRFEVAARDIYEAGVLCPTIPSRRSRTLDLRIAALFLKRALNDFRAAWLLTLVGYTSQSASVAASLWEHALAVQVLAGNEERARKFLNSDGNLPWTPRKLSTLSTLGEKDQDLARDEVYAAYKWLCKIKHPTGPTARWDTLATEHGGKFVVMASPDVSEHDLLRKALIMLTMVSRLHQAEEAFANAAVPDRESAAYVDFAARLERAHSESLAAFKAIEELPEPTH